MKTAEKLQRDIVDQLAWDPAVDSSHVAVTIADEGIVTLTGRVASYAEKLSAEAAAKRVRGVKAVANDIEVSPTPAMSRDDSAIAQAAVNALKWAVTVPNDIKVTVSKGWIHLDGEVEWRYQKSAAYNVVRNLLGVKGVTNQIMIKPRIRAGELKEKIERAFVRSAEIDADHVTIEVQGNRIILKGTVRSWSEHDEAEDAAWAAPGVEYVENKLEVQPMAFA